MYRMADKGKLIIDEKQAEMVRLIQCRQIYAYQLSYAARIASFVFGVGN